MTTDMPAFKAFHAWWRSDIQKLYTKTEELREEFKSLKQTGPAEVERQAVMMPPAEPTPDFPASSSAQFRSNECFLSGNGNVYSNK